MNKFENYESERQRLIKKCDEVVRIWQLASSGKSELEQLLTGSSEGEPSSVDRFINEARMRLASSTVELGIFGMIKRGKSTLVNALVGTDVSPMRVTPETAVPVWIESGDRQTIVVLENGTVLEGLTLEEARLMATQRYKPAKIGEKPLRVIHRLPITWLPPGVRVIDTPGLDDPSLADDYEKLTLAELDRVAATVFILTSPPGPSGEEIRILRSLGARAVDKLFLVCNFYPDQWNDPEVREQMTEYIEGIVADGAGDGVDRSDVRVYPISAKSGFKSSLADDSEGFEDSGVAELRRDLEAYLAGGALERMLGYVEYRIKMSSQLVVDLLLQRRQVLHSPELVKPLASKLKSDIVDSQSRLKELEREIIEASRSLNSELGTIVSRPVQVAIDAVSKATKRPELEVIFHRMRLQFETAASEASSVFDQRAGYEYARLHRKLFDSFGVEERIQAATTGLNLNRAAAEIAPSMPGMNMDKTTVAAGSLATGATLGILGGIVAGGAGMALIALGPIGWLIGAGIGAVAGSAAGGLATHKMTRDTLATDARKSVSDELSLSLARVRAEVDKTTSNWSTQAIDNLQSFSRSFFREREVELERIESILADVKGREREIARIDGLLENLQQMNR